MTVSPDAEPPLPPNQPPELQPPSDVAPSRDSGFYAVDARTGEKVPIAGSDFWGAGGGLPSVARSPDSDSSLGEPSGSHAGDVVHTGAGQVALGSAWRELLMTEDSGTPQHAIDGTTQQQPRPRGAGVRATAKVPVRATYVVPGGPDAPLYLKHETTVDLSLMEDEVVGAPSTTALEVRRYTVQKPPAHPV